MAAQHSPSLFSFLSKRLCIALLDVHARLHAIANRLRELEGEVEVLHALTLEQKREPPSPARIITSLSTMLASVPAGLLSVCWDTLPARMPYQQREVTALHSRCARLWWRWTNRLAVYKERQSAEGPAPA